MHTHVCIEVRNVNSSYFGSLGGIIGIIIPLECSHESRCIMPSKTTTPTCRDHAL